MEKFTLHQVASRGSVFADDVRAGLARPAKAIPPRWFYDELGSVLFDAICLLPEYYVTRAETEIFETHAAEIADAMRGAGRLIELGSGTARKTRLLLPHLDAVEYVPVDIDCTMVEKTGRRIAEELDAVRVTSVCGDFTDPSAILGSLPPSEGATTVLFLGSTIGNLDHAASASMLTGVRRQLRPGDQFLLGADLKKDSRILHAAYNDALGVTAAFNLNLLTRINRELGGQFDIAAFRHRACFNEAAGRIEMYLDSTRAQAVAIESLGMTVEILDGEAIHTENSYKYTLEELGELARGSGFGVARSWTDQRGWFADVLFVAE
ncbi:MAG: L-histidine N(alpha)-methyltransferase [Thermoanaerobaculia bacterium]